MSTEAGKAHVMKCIDDANEGLTACVVGLAQDPAVAMGRARAFLRDDIADKLAYLDVPPTGPLPIAMFFAAAHLAVWLALKEKSVGVHDFGAAILTHRDKLLRTMQDDGENGFESPGTHPWEFDIEPVANGFNVTSCSECSLYAKFGAMDLMP